MPVRIDLNPKVEVQTSMGPVFIYEASSDVLNAYAQQPAEAVLPKVRRYLGRISSTTERKNWSDGYAPLTDAEIQALTDDETERMAEAYLETLNSLYFINEARKARPALRREDDESATAFLDRLLVFRVKHERDTARRLLEPYSSGTKSLVEQTFGRTASALEELNRQATGLSALAAETRRHQSHLDEMRKIALKQPPDLDIAPPPVFDTMRRIEEQRRRERNEELELARRMGDMTMRAAEHLAQVSQTTTTILGQFGDFLGQFAEGSRRADEKAQRSLRIAVWSIIVAAILTALSAGVEFASFRQDAGSNQSNDKWQQDISQALRRQADMSEQSIKALSTENAQLRRRLEALERANPLAKP